MEHERVELLIDGQVTVIEWLNGARVDQHQISVHMMFAFAFCVSSFQKTVYKKKTN